MSSLSLSFYNWVEILSYAIRNHGVIKGIKINETEIRNILFADDMTVVLDGTEESFKASVYILDEFEKTSGLKLNPSKCTVLRVGNLKKKKTQTLHI